MRLVTWGSLGGRQTLAEKTLLVLLIGPMSRWEAPSLAKEGIGKEA
jgi:hypothetical protein